MSQQTIVAIISGIVGVSIAIIRQTDFWDRSRVRLRKDIELYSLLPDKSSSKQKLLTKIDEEINSLIIGDSVLRRDVTGIVLALLFVAAGAYLSWFFIDKGSWWLFGLIVSIFMVVLGFVGFTQDAVKRERDERGRPVKKAAKYSQQKSTS